MGAMDADEFKRLQDSAVAHAGADRGPLNMLKAWVYVLARELAATRTEMKALRGEVKAAGNQHLLDGKMLFGVVR